MNVILASRHLPSYSYCGLGDPSGISSGKRRTCRARPWSVPNRRAGCGQSPASVRRRGKSRSCADRRHAREPRTSRPAPPSRDAGRTGESELCRPSATEPRTIRWSAWASSCRRAVFLPALEIVHDRPQRPTRVIARPTVSTYHGSILMANVGTFSGCSSIYRWMPAAKLAADVLHVRRGLLSNIPWPAPRCGRAS